MKTVPFYSNTPDDTHCFQAAFRMILKYFLPETDFSWEELDIMSGKFEGLSTWPQQMLLKFTELGFEVTLTEAFDARAFIQDGETYLRKTFGDETTDWQVKNSNIPAEQERYREFLASDNTFEHREPTYDDIKHYLSAGYLLTCVINSCALNGKKGYVGHSVVIYNISDDKITFHDPGLPPQENRVAALRDFEKAWAYPNANAKSLIAVKYKGSDE